MMSLSIIDRNANIIQNHFYDHMRDTMQVLNKVIHREVDKISFLLRPAVSVFFGTMGKPLIERMGKQTINDTLDLGKNLIEKKIPKSSNEFYQLLDMMLPKLLENDQTIQYCRKSHHNFKKLENAVKKIFESQVIPIMQLLMVEDTSICDYSSLCKAACTKTEIESLLTAQIGAMEESIRIIEEDLNILNVPIARDFVIRVIKEGIKIKRNSFFVELDQIYA